MTLALLKSFDPKNIATWPLRGQIAAVSVGYVDGTACLDLPYEEDSRAEVDMNVAMTDGGKFVEIQGTAESIAFDRAQLDAMLSLAEGGLVQLFHAQRQALEPSGFPVLEHVR